MLLALHPPNDCGLARLLRCHPPLLAVLPPPTHSCPPTVKRSLAMGSPSPMPLTRLYPTTTCWCSPTTVSVTVLLAVLVTEDSGRAAMLLLELEEQGARSSKFSFGKLNNFNGGGFGNQAGKRSSGLAWLPG
jgi:hypothetical protein